MEKILVCDDEKNITTVISKILTNEGYQVVTCYDGQEAIDCCFYETFDLIILDIMMPNIDGYQAAKSIRKKYKTPIIMLSAKSQEYDKVQGFELGIDDYITKPFSNRELVLRIKAILARVNQHVPGTSVLNHQELVIDMLSRKVSVNDTVVKLSFKDYELLLYLLKNKGVVLTRERIINSVWGYDFYGDERTLDTHIKLLRKNLLEAGKYIVTARGVGYTFED